MWGLISRPQRYHHHALPTELTDQTLIGKSWEYLYQMRTPRRLCILFTMLHGKIGWWIKYILAGVWSDVLIRKVKKIGYRLIRYWSRSYFLCAKQVLYHLISLPLHWRQREQTTSILCFSKKAHPLHSGCTAKFFPVNSYLESSFLSAQAWPNKQLSKVLFWLVLNSSITNTRHQTASVDAFVFPWGDVFVAHKPGGGGGGTPLNLG